MTIAIIQARVSSTRLPGKVLKNIMGKSLLEHELLRIGQAKKLDKIIVAIPDKKEDNLLASIIEKTGVVVFRGAEDDVLDRYFHAAKKYHADIIVRLTGDCPLIDPRIIDKTIAYYLSGNYDYVTNANPPTFPDGMDTEVFSFTALKLAWEKADLISEREHVTPYIWKNRDIFKVGNLANKNDFSSIRLTVDEPEDLLLVEKIINELYPENPDFSLADILKLLEERPEFLRVNSNISRNEGYSKSIKKDGFFKKLSE